MSVTEIARLRVGIGKGDEFERRLPIALGALSSHEACQDVASYRGVEDPDVFFLVVTWTSIEAHSAWRDSEERKIYKSQTVDLLAEPPSFAHYTPLQVR